MQNQEQLFMTRRSLLRSDLQSIEESIQGQQGLLQAYAGMLANRRNQLSLINEELGNLRGLVKEGYAPRNRQLEMERMAADSSTAIADLQGNTVRAQRAMGELRLGNPDALKVDVGPVIDAQARSSILAHIDALRSKGHRVYQHQARTTFITDHGTFVPPTLIEIGSIAELEREVFGPVLHLVRYARKDLPRLLQQINATGYGLTLGVHTRIDETIAQVVDQARAGNVYVNRNMVGAVVGVQPFGGEGLSGTGPKAGGPLLLWRLSRAGRLAG